MSVKGETLGTCSFTTIAPHHKSHGCVNWKPVAPAELVPVNTPDAATFVALRLSDAILSCSIGGARHELAVTLRRLLAEFSAPVAPLASPATNCDFGRNKFTSGGKQNGGEMTKVAEVVAPEPTKEPKTLADLARCPKCKSADIRIAQVVYKYVCNQCAYQFMEPYNVEPVAPEPQLKMQANISRACEAAAAELDTVFVLTGEQPPENVATIIRKHIQSAVAPLAPPEPTKEPMLHKETCILCGETRTGTIEMPPHECPAIGKFSPEVLQMTHALFAASWCDHFCCGKSDLVCKAESALRYLKENPVGGLALGRDTREQVENELQKEFGFRFRGNTLAWHSLQKAMATRFDKDSLNVPALLWDALVNTRLERDQLKEKLRRLKPLSDEANARMTAELDEILYPEPKEEL